MVAYITDLKEKVKKLENSELKGALLSYLDMREMIYSMLEKVPEEKLGYKPADKPEVHTLRECFAELARVELSRIKGFKTGINQHGAGHEALSDEPTKQEILDALKKMDVDLVDLITSPDFDPNKQMVRQNRKGEALGKTKILWSLWGMRNHENMHLGMIRRDLDAIGVQPSEEYVKYWYG